MPKNKIVAFQPVNYVATTNTNKTVTTKLRILSIMPNRAKQSSVQY